MKRQFKIFVPAASAEQLTHALRCSFGAQVVLKPSPTAVLELETLRSFYIRLNGSVMHSRAPFIYPLMSGDLHRYYLTNKGQHLSNVAGADWVFLGGSMPHFIHTLSQHMTIHSVSSITIQPFGSVAGKFARNRQPGDTPVTMCKQPCFHNDRCVQSIKEQLISVDPEHWKKEEYYLVTDRYETVAPLIQKYLPAPPRTIVDIGCGLGHNTHSLAKAFPTAKVVGYDFSEASIEVASKSFTLPNLSYQVGDFTRPLPFDDKSVDLLVSIEATNMSALPAVTAAEFCRILSTQGLMINVSLSESSYIYWDYPASLFMPTHMNSFATDWFFAARTAGLGFRLEPWSLSSFTYIPCRDESFFKAHQQFLSSRIASEEYRLYHDRFAMIVGPNITGQKPVGMNQHFMETNYINYVARCIGSFDSTDSELEKFTRWGLDLVQQNLQLLSGAQAFLNTILPESRALPFRCE